MKHKKGSGLSDSRHAHQASFLESTRVQRCLSASDIIAAAPAGVVQLWVSQGKLPWWHHLRANACQYAAGWWESSLSSWWETPTGVVMCSATPHTEVPLTFLDLASSSIFFNAYRNGKKCISFLPWKKMSGSGESFLHNFVVSWALGTCLASKSSLARSWEATSTLAAVAGKVRMETWLLEGQNKDAHKIMSPGKTYGKSNSTNTISPKK